MNKERLSSSSKVAFRALVDIISPVIPSQKIREHLPHLKHESDLWQEDVLLKKIISLAHRIVLGLDKEPSSSEYDYQKRLAPLFESIRLTASNPSSQTYSYLLKPLSADSIFPKASTPPNAMKTPQNANTRL
ncbi:hypothetical protein [Basilea psittacipulmonis]|uniref:hypothetical protein n=1 Tax=Basilea psittacipulmonis TaxID=1472345 RepID=UPI0006903226|nr:hypothetical protein [Basilea psittacipulmonis]